MESELSKREKLFNNRIEGLEQKYHIYFKDRKSANTEERDKISNHYILRLEPETLANLVWLEESDLREDIKAEATAIFKQVFNS